METEQKAARAEPELAEPAAEPVRLTRKGLPDKRFTPEGRERARKAWVKAKEVRMNLIKLGKEAREKAKQAQMQPPPQPVSESEDDDPETALDVLGITNEALKDWYEYMEFKRFKELSIKEPPVQVPKEAVQAKEAAPAQPKAAPRRAGARF